MALDQVEDTEVAADHLQEAVGSQVREDHHLPLLQVDHGQVTEEIIMDREDHLPWQLVDRDRIIMLRRLQHQERM